MLVFKLDHFYFPGHLCRPVPNALRLLVDRVFGDVPLSREELSRLAPLAAAALTECVTQGDPFPEGARYQLSLRQGGCWWPPEWKIATVVSAGVRGRETCPVLDGRGREFQMNVVEGSESARQFLTRTSRIVCDEFLHAR